MREHSGSGPIRVLLADDHTLFRRGLAKLLASYGGLEIVGEVPNDQEALTQAQEEKPDVVIMQVQMPFERAKESLLKMREISPAPKVVIATIAVLSTAFGLLGTLLAVPTTVAAGVLVEELWFRRLLRLLAKDSYVEVP